MSRFRRYLAWRLVNLARRLHDGEYVDYLTLEVDGEEIARVSVIGDPYNGGICSTVGIDWQDAAGPGRMNAELPAGTWYWWDSEDGWEDGEE